jgi:hypothetical protein
MSWTEDQGSSKTWQNKKSGFEKTYILPTTGVWFNPTIGTWTVPNGVQAIKVEAIGSGGGGITFNDRYGGGGGAYACTEFLQVTPGQTIFYQTIAGENIAAGSFDAWLNTQFNSPPISKEYGVLAKGGKTGSLGLGRGGRADECIGDVAYSGGNGGMSSGATGGFPDGGGGGGGAAGPNGPGADGGAGSGITIDGGGGGGGANGGFAGQNSSISESRGGAGGNNRFGTGGGSPGLLTVLAGVGVNGGGGGGTWSGVSSPQSLRVGSAGGMEVIWTDSVTNVAAGPGGGGGGSRSLSLGGSGANYGGGSGSFTGLTGSGLIVITALQNWNMSPEQIQVWTQV